MSNLNKRLHGFTPVVLLLLLVFTAAAEAQEAVDKTLAPYFFIEGGDPAKDHLPLKETDTVINISGVMAEVIITQRYTNEGQRPIHARYIFPASTRAAVHDMKMTVGDQVIRAQVMKRQAAKQKYEAAKKAGKSASLLEQQRPNVFSMKVANILPGDTIEVELSYSEFLVPTDGTYELVFPTVVGPRYDNQPESSASEYDQWVKNPYFKKGQEPTAGDDEAGAEKRMICKITTHIASGVPLQELTCTTHKTHIDWQNESEATISLDQTEIANGSSGDRDYIIRYRLAGQKIVSGLMLYKGEQESFFLLMVQPPARVEAADIPWREYIFVVDVSGSMNGFPLNTSKTLLQDLIGHLRPTDTFNVLLFAGGSQLMVPRSIPAVQENLDRAIAFINQQRGGGGTEMLRAIKQAVSLPHEEDCSRNIVLVTDGYVAFEQDVFAYIRQHLNNANVYAFGIGSGVNRYLIEGVAKAGYGESFVVTKPQEAAAEANNFRRYIQSPVLTNISARFEGFEAYEVEPGSIPDLLAQRPIVIFGKWRGEPTGVIRVSGLSGQGEYSQAFPVADTLPSPTNRSLKYLWARTRIADLSDYNFTGSTVDQEAEVTSLGLTYNLLTKYTSFVAVYEKIRNTEGGEDVNQPLPLPKGVSNLAVGGGIARSPEPPLSLLLAITAIFFLLVFLRKSGVLKALSRLLEW
jgi:Ca-activated chloride channel family protein